MRAKKGEMDLGYLQARQNLPSDFSYGGVACELTTTTKIFAPIFASNIRNVFKTDLNQVYI
jgi:hypothetical protein